MRIEEPTEDDIDELIDIRNRSFGMVPADRMAQTVETRRRAIAENRAVVVRDGARPVASASYIRFRQWWLGRPVEMAGVSAVVVAPEYRSRGVGGAMMRALLERMHAHGFPLSALYPATMPPYRRVGYELAGTLTTVTVPADALRGLARGRDVPMPRRVGREDADATRATTDDVQRRNRECGPVTWPVEAVAGHLGEGDQFTYLVDGDGFLSYRWDGPDALHVGHAVAGSPDAARALWAQVGTGSSIARSVHAQVAPDDPLFWLLPDVGVEARGRSWWMLRLLDAPAAVAARGFPAGVEVDVPVALSDDLLPHNGGRWRLRVGAGSGSLVEDDAGAGDPLRTDARGFAALYAGAPLSTLRRAELVTGGDPDADSALDAAFRGPAFCRDDF